jgi:hypothetical protein
MREVDPDRVRMTPRCDDTEPFAQLGTSPRESAYPVMPTRSDDTEPKSTGQLGTGRQGSAYRGMRTDEANAARVDLPAPLVPVISFFPGRSLRWVAESCRAKRIPGAVRVGKQWLIRESEIAAFIAGTGRPRGVPTVEDAAADLRRRGIL